MSIHSALAPHHWTIHDDGKQPDGRGTPRLNLDRRSCIARRPARPCPPEVMSWRRGTTLKRLKAIPLREPRLPDLQA